MVGFEDIYGALQALWKSKTGASIWAIKQQPVLMGLEHVAAHARQELDGVDQLTSDQIAGACQSVLYDACNSWANTPDDPEIARMILGLVKGVRGVERRVRRKRIPEKHDISEEKLTHTRNGSSYETRALIVIAETLLHSEQEYVGSTQDHLDVSLDELDYIYPYLDDRLQCLSYSAELDIPYGDLPTTVILRSMKFAYTRDKPQLDGDKAQLVGFHDGWLTEGIPNEIDNFGSSGLVPSTIARTEDNQKLISALVDPAFSGKGTLELGVSTLYSEEPDTPSKKRFGFCVSTDGPPTEVSLSVSLLEGETNLVVKAQVVRYSDTDTVVEKQWDVQPDEEDCFKLYVKQAVPGLCYLLSWKVDLPHR